MTGRVKETRAPLSVISISRSGRRQAVAMRLIVSVVALLSGASAVILAALYWYTPLVHHFAAGNGLGLDIASAGTYISALFAHNVAAMVNTAVVREPPRTSSVPTVRLWARKNVYDELNRGILRYKFGGMPRKPRFKGISELEDGRLLRVNIGFRGANRWHHQQWKPSLRVRYRKARLSDGFRNHHLIAPEDGTGLRNWLSDELAREWKMLTYGEHFVRLFLNQRYKGIYTRRFKLDESLLIHQGLLPGPFFRLEGNTGPLFTRTGSVKIEDPAEWEMAVEERAVAEPALGLLLAALARCPISDDLGILDELVDREAMAKWLSLMAHAASAHTDLHNLAIWLDPASGKFVPLMIDVGGYGWFYGRERDRQPLLLLRNFLVHCWLQNPFNQALYAESLYQLVNTTGSSSAVNELVETTWARIREDALADVHISDMGARNGTQLRTLVPLTTLDENVRSITDFVRNRNEFLLDELRRDELILVERRGDRFEVLIVGISGAVARKRDETELTLIGSERSSLEVELLPVFPRVREDRIRDLEHRGVVSYAFYELEGESGDYLFSHRLSGEEIVPISLSDPRVALVAKELPELRQSVGLSPLRRQAPDLRPVVIGPGEVVLTGKTVLPEGKPVVVRAGTRISMGAEATLLVRGKLSIQGVEHAPVIVRPLDSEKPFGVLALVGEQTAGSSIENLDLEGGSTDRFYNLELTGMLSIHNCPQVLIRDSRFGPNLGGDDTVHVVSSSARIVRCEFEGALADAVDWDRVDGIIADSTFSRIGNDGADLSMGRVTVRNSRFESCGDKCVSAGEGVRVSLLGNSFSGCDIGVAVKDSAQALVERCRFDSCRVGYSSYMKKWRWGTGGVGWFRQTTIVGSLEADIEGDERSLVYLPEAAGWRQRGGLRGGSWDQASWPGWLER